MLLDPTAYQRLENEGSLGATSTGASFATSTGDMLEVTAYAGGAFRVRLGPNTRPDYGLIVGHMAGTGYSASVLPEGETLTTLPPRKNALQ